jgi:PGF-CTERM protein
MVRPDGRLRPGRLSVSRRRLLQTGVAAALTTGGVSSVSSGVDLAGAELKSPPLVWQTNVEQSLDPRVEVFDGAGVAVAFTPMLGRDSGTLYAVDIENGDVRWTRQIDEPPALQAGDDVLYHQSLGELAALDPTTGEPRWRLAGRFGNPAEYDARFAAFSGDGRPATVVDLAAGEIAWRPPQRALENAAFVHDDVVVLHGNGRLVAFNALEQQPVWSITDLPEGEYTTSVVGTWPYGFVYDTAGGQTVAVDLDQGKQLWSEDRLLTPGVFETEAGEIVLAGGDGTVVRLDPTDGTELWSTELADKPVAVYHVQAGLAVPVAEDEIWALDVSDGSIEWNHEIESVLPVVRGAGDAIFAAGEDIESLENDGEAAWSYDLFGSRHAYPDLGENTLVAAAGQSILGFALDGERDTITPTETPGATDTPTPTPQPTDTPTTDTPTTEPRSTPTSAPTTTGPGTDRTTTAADRTTDPGTEPATESTPTTTRRSETPNAPTATTESGDDGIGITDATGPGFGAVAALLGLGGLAEYLRRQDTDE